MGQMNTHDMAGYITEKSSLSTWLIFKFMVSRKGFLTYSWKLIEDLLRMRSLIRKEDGMGNI